MLRQTFGFCKAAATDTHLSEKQTARQMDIIYLEQEWDPHAGRVFDLDERHVIKCYTPFTDRDPRDMMEDEHQLATMLSKRGYPVAAPSTCVVVQGSISGFGLVMEKIYGQDIEQMEQTAKLKIAKEHISILEGIIDIGISPTDFFLRNAIYGHTQSDPTSKLYLTGLSLWRRAPPLWMLRETREQLKSYRKHICVQGCFS